MPQKGALGRGTTESDTLVGNDECPIESGVGQMERRSWGGGKG